MSQGTRDNCTPTVETEPSGHRGVPNGLTEPIYCHGAYYPTPGTATTQLLTSNWHWKMLVNCGPAMRNVTGHVHKLYQILPTMLTNVFGTKQSTTVGQNIVHRMLDGGLPLNLQSHLNVCLKGNGPWRNMGKNKTEN